MRPPYTLAAGPMEFGPGPTCGTVVVTQWGADEVSPSGARHSLCECGHPTEAEALECARPKSIPELARVAFEAYGESTGGKTWDGKPIPPFDAVRERTPHVARAWEAAVAAVLGR